ncbi:protein NLP2-like [Typha latifolia]|uniref:protein NLP2-like n=1 Tax=Typha latifolia TaxID=4733 RepID=UPI003C2C7BC7
MEGLTPLDCGTGTATPDDPLTLAALMNFDGYAELCSPSTREQIFSALSYSAFQQMPDTWSSYASPITMIECKDGTDKNGDASVGSYSGCNEKITSQMINLQDEYSENSPDMGGICRNSSNFASGNNSDQAVSIVPKRIASISFAERMLKALSLFKESSGGGILAQVWMPVKQGEQYVLSTFEQPFLLDEALAGYREVSRHFTFSAREASGLFLGLPGRVFISGMPEWTSNVVYYHKLEYLRVEYARRHEVCGSLAVPVFDSSKGSCCAVLELVTRKEKSDFYTEMDSVCNALQAVNLRTVKARAYQQNFTKSQKSAFTEILDVLRAICHAHMLPLALTWYPICHDDQNLYVSLENNDQEVQSSISKKTMLCIQEEACYLHDMRMQGFLHACAEHRLEKGQGIVGKALQSNHPFYSSDVRDYGIREYPLAHHARKFGLRAAVAIRLRSTYTGNDDYILEFFLPVNCRGSDEQQLLLNNLSSTMQRISRTLRTISNTEIVGDDVNKDIVHKGAGIRYPSTDLSANSSQHIDSDSQLMTKMTFGNQNVGSDEQGGAVQPDRLKSCLMRHPEKKRSMAERNISLSVLQQYFSGSLKDAAKSIGVCPTTLKRICRQHGISRWPSRKINKVNRSLKKIQNVINSVQGVEGALKYDPATGCLVAAVSSPEKTASRTLDHTGRDVRHVFESEHPDKKLEPEYPLIDDKNQTESSGKLQHPTMLKSERDEFSVPVNNCVNVCKYTGPDGGVLEHANVVDASGLPLHSRVVTKASYPMKEAGYQGTSEKVSSCFESLGDQMKLRSTSSVAGLNKMNVKIDNDDGVMEHSHPSTSSMTDSSSGSASSHLTFKKSSKCSLITESGPAITVKATYKGDTVRFKFLPSMSCQDLFEEIAKRFKLLTETFQLKYMDDEEEWVILASESDLLECLDVLESIGSRSLKLQVRDVPYVFSSPASSSCLLMEP